MKSVPPVVFEPRIVLVRDPRYLSDDDVAILTGLRNKRRQAAQLSFMKIPFAFNACGQPIVPVSAIEGRLAEARREVAGIEQRIAWARSSLR